MFSTLPRRTAVLLLLAAMTASAQGALPAGYTFQGILEAIPPGSLHDGYAQQVASVATAVNASNSIVGFWLRPDGTFVTHNMQFGTNPKFLSLHAENFIGLSSSNSSCFGLFGMFLCKTYGIRVIPPAEEGGVATGVSAFFNTAPDASVVPGSLPHAQFPGNFVEENATGVLATTQVDALGQFGVLVHKKGAVTLEDVPWLVAINDLPEPLVLGWNGSNGDCLVFGEGCPDDGDMTCFNEHGRPHRGHGRGHEEHGNGHGYGHDKCVCSSQTLQARTRTPVARTGIDLDLSGTTPDVDFDASPNESLVIRLLADGTTVRYRFPQSVTGTDDLANTFPLAINNTHAILRGDVRVGSHVLDKRLLSCAFNPAALDADGDGVIDCIGGLTLVGGSDASTRVGTVLGFTLNNKGILVGNLGHNAAGTGAPFVLDILDPAPEARLLANLAGGTAQWEITSATDLNDNGLITGYGYRNCGAQPEGLFLTEATSAPAGTLRFARGAFEYPALLEPGGVLAITPTLTGSTGEPEFRVQIRTPADIDWSLLSDWSATPARWAAGDYLGEVCFRIEARDTAAPAAVVETVVRYLVAEVTPDNGQEEGEATSVVNLAPNERFRLTDLLGAPGLFMMLSLAVLALRRRVG